MDFFEQQAATGRRSTRLLALFAATLAAYFVLLGALPSLFNAVWSLGCGHGWQWIWAWPAFGLFAGTAVFFFAAGAAIEWINLAGGGPALAERLGAEPLLPANLDLAERRLLNIVEEIALASGRPAPRVFVLRRETALNALTAGRGADDAVLIVTQGCLERLSRDELQGVVAHEFSHLLHADTALDSRLVALLSGLLFIPELGLDLLRAGWTEGTDARTGQPVSGPTPLLLLAPLAVILTVVGYTGFLLARALQAAATRQRELLADASAVQFTRNPAGLTGALAKIAAAPDQRLSGPAAAAKLGHLLFAPARHSQLLDFLALHPPLAARLARLGAPPRALAPSPVSGSTAARSSLAGLSVLREELGSYVGTAAGPAADPLGHSQRLLASLPPAVVVAAREFHGAAAVVLGLLLSDDPDQCPAQLALVRRLADPKIGDALGPLGRILASLPRAHRLPLLGLALPALQAQPDAAKTRLLATAHALAETDGEISLFEFALLQSLKRRLAPSARRQPFGSPSPFAFGQPPLSRFAPPFGVLLSACARTDIDTREQAEHAFATGCALFPTIANRLSLTPAPGCGLDAISAALDSLASAPEAYRRILLAACARAVNSNRVVSIEEAELVRAIADALDCPLPPLLGEE